MATWRSLASIAAIFIVAGQLHGQTVTLQEKDLAGSHFQIRLNMELKGEIRIFQNDKEETVPQMATAQHAFVERVLQTGQHQLIDKAARHYGTAEITLKFRDKVDKRSLRDDRRLIIAQRSKDEVITFCPTGPLMREELDLTGHFDTLALPGLLPGKAVAIGETWKISNAAAQAVASFDGLTSHELTGKLEGVSGKLASISIHGTASGIDAGAAVKIDVSAKCQFDTEVGRITSMEWTQTDQRDQGPVSPAMNLTVTIRLDRQVISHSDAVNDLALAPAPQGDIPVALLALSYTDPQGRYQLAHARDWIPVARTEQHLIFRLLERGEFIAQATVTNWPKAEKGKHDSSDDFTTAMAESPGWEQQEVLEAKEVKAADGYWIYRIAATGLLNGLKTVQYFYLVAGPNGDQLVLAFTATPAQAQRLGTRDLDMVRSVVFPKGE